VVAGATRVAVAAPEAAAALVRRAAAARACEATALNAASSRSHSVFMLNIAGAHAASGVRLTGGLNLVDLAGRRALVWGTVWGFGVRKRLRCTQCLGVAARSCQGCACAAAQVTGTREEREDNECAKARSIVKPAVLSCGMPAPLRARCKRPARWGT